jgi:transcriptional regulator EpsA
MSRAQVAAIDALSAEAAGVTTIDEYKTWTRGKIRPVFPHKVLISGYGHLHAGGVAIDYLVTVDFPPGYLQRLRNRAGAIDTPILRRWLATREPQLFESDRPWPDAPAAWLGSFRESGLKNIAAHAVTDTERCVGTYHSFHRIPGRLGAAHAEALKRIVPVMHEVLCRVIELVRVDRKFAMRLAGLSSREREMAQWVRSGKTNSEIASLSGVSENTVKHHLTKIFGKLAVESRMQLVQRLAEHDANAAPGSGTKIL